MSNIHSRNFTLFMQELDGIQLSPAQAAQFQAHLADCPACRDDRRLYQELHQQATARWPLYPTGLAAYDALGAVQKTVQRRRQWQRAIRPLQAAAWVCLALIAILLVQFVFSAYPPAPVEMPVAGPRTPVPLIFDTPGAEIEEYLVMTKAGFDSPEAQYQYDHFGAAVDIEGDWLVAGAPRWGLGTGDGAGTAYVFHRSTAGEWLPEAVLTASDRDDGFQVDQHFGEAVALQGTTIVVGAPGYDDITTGDDTGAVYIFELTGGTWQETGRLTSSQPIPGARLGRAVAFHGDTLAVSGDPAAGSVTIFERLGGSWHEAAWVPVPSGPDGERYYVDIDLFGNTLAISTIPLYPQDETDEEALLASMTQTATVILYEWSGGEWVQTSQLAPRETSLFHMNEGPYGVSVALGGEGGAGDATWLAVGMPGFTGTAQDRGSVMIYEGEKDGWQPSAELSLAPGEAVPGALPFFGADPGPAFFGVNVEIEGSRLAVISTFANTVYVFERQNAGWSYAYRLTPGAEYGDDFQNRPVAISGSSLLLGNPGELGEGKLLLFGWEK